MKTNCLAKRVVFMIIPRNKVIMNSTYSFIFVIGIVKKIKIFRKKCEDEKYYPNKILLQRKVRE